MPHNSATTNISYCPDERRRVIIFSLHPDDVISMGSTFACLTHTIEALRGRKTGVKYGWAPFQENNVVNSSKLPLAPFKVQLRGNN